MFCPDFLQESSFGGSVAIKVLLLTIYHCIYKQVSLKVTSSEPILLSPTLRFSKVLMRIGKISILCAEKYCK